MFELLGTFNTSGNPIDYATVATYTLFIEVM